MGRRDGCGDVYPLSSKETRPEGGQDRQSAAKWDGAPEEARTAAVGKGKLLYVRDGLDAASERARPGAACRV